MATIRPTAAPRILQTHLEALASRHPVVTLTGPRQSGKTTLCRATFPEHAYVNLERPNLREQARTDPLGLLRGHESGVVIDEVQHVPELLSWIQADVDEDMRPGRFILTGSQHFGMLAGVAQSLAGRTAICHLLPLTLNELRRFEQPPASLWDTVWTGGYPAIYDRRLPPQEWLSAYVATYIDRDVRQVIQVKDITPLQTFVRLCAGRTGQELNIAGLAADAGVAHGTARAWIGVLQTSFILTLLPPWLGNLRKRIVKRPKLHFVDTGVACWLLGIGSPAELSLHSARGALFESWVVGEAMKARLHAGLPANLFYVRDAKGREIDLIVERHGKIPLAVEVKSGATVSGDQLAGLRSLRRSAQGDGIVIEAALVHGGDDARRWHDVDIVGWERVAGVGWR